MKKYVLAVLIVLFMFATTACSNKENNQHSNLPKTKNDKPLIIVYGDFKCPYCQKVEKNVMPTIKEKYIDKDKVSYQFVNMAILGKDSVRASRAGHAVEQYAPNNYLDFQKNIYMNQGQEDKEWLTEEYLDKHIDKLDISNQTKEQIKHDYKQKDSDSWKAAKKDQQNYKKHHIEKAPTVFIKGKKVEDPYKVENWEKLIN